MNKGDLVKNRSNGEVGICLDNAGIGNLILIFLGDGLMMAYDISDWEAVPFYPGATIPANFAELISVEGMFLSKV